ncbi:hypothetical protein ACKWTF_008711 [Chironomus riparius]
MSTVNSILILPIFFAVLILANEIKYKAIFDSCIRSESATIKDLETIFSGVLPETRSEKCVAACLSERFGAMVDNQLSYDGLKKNLIEQTNIETKALDIADQMFERCGNITDTDRCEAASKIHTCLYELSHLC